MTGPTTKGGTIAASETWMLDGSPYQITDTITLAKNVALFIEAGVEIEVQKKDSKIIIGDGSALHFGGTRDAPIHMHGQIATKDYYAGIEWSAASGKLHAAYLTVENAAKAIRYPSAIGCDTWLEDCLFRNNDKVFSIEKVILDPTVDMYVRRCLFERNNFVFHGSPIVQPYTEAGGESGYYIIDNTFRENLWAIVADVGTLLCGITLYGNKFYRNKRGAVWAKALSYGTLNVANNWWGSDSGPLDAVNNPTGTGDLILNQGAVGLTLTVIPWTTLGRYVPVRDDVREYVNRILREGTPSGEIISTALLSDESLDRIVDRAEKTFDSWLSDELLEKRLLGYGTETDETFDLELDDSRIGTRYRPIAAISALSLRTGSATYSAVSENENSGYYASAADKRLGIVRLASSPTYLRDSGRLSYAHGYYDAPEAVRDACLKLATLEVLSVILKGGEADAYAARAAALRLELNEIRQTAERNWKRPEYAVL